MSIVIESIILVIIVGTCIRAQYKELLRLRNRVKLEKARMTLQIETQQILKTQIAENPANSDELEIQIKDMQSKITLQRLVYNDYVVALNDKIEKFPTSLIAMMFQFERESYME